MDANESVIGALLAIVLFAVAVFFAWRQRTMLQKLRAEVDLPAEHRQALMKQCQRRMFGSILLFILASMMFGTLFLDFDPVRKPLADLPVEEQEAAKQSVRFLGVYVMSMLLLLLVVVALAVIDFWATARYGMLQQKRLLQEHQEMLAAELAEYRHRKDDDDTDD